MQFNPMDYPTTFLEPVILNLNSAWIEHIPFAFTLVELLRPNRFVELGVHHGDSYCSFCKAVKHLALPTECYGIDTWEGDPHAGAYSADVLTKLRAHHDPQYSSFSRLLQMDFDAGAAQFEPESVDLLHIDGLHTYQAVKHDFQTWLPKMSRQGIILFHDTMIHRDDFGVFQLWAELTDRYPHFHFEHGSGLGMIAVGANVADAFQSLFNATPSQAKTIRDFYARLGREIDLRRYYSGVMRIVFHGQAQINQWKRQVGLPVTEQSQNFGDAITNGIVFAQNTVEDIGRMAMIDLNLRCQMQSGGRKP